MPIISKILFLLSGVGAHLSDHCYANPSQPIHAVTWFLVVIFLLSYLNSINNPVIGVFGEIYKLYSSVPTGRKSRRNKPYSKELMIFCMTLAGYS